MASPLGETLERIRLSAGMRTHAGHRAWLEILNLWSEDYRQFLRGEKEIPADSLSRLAEHLDLSLDDLLIGKVDFRALQDSFGSAGTEFPEKYSIAAFGRRRTTITSLDFIESHTGWRTRADCLDHFGVSESAFLDPMAPISMAFITDLCAYLHKKHQYGSKDFFAMGAHSSMGNRNTVLSKSYSRARNPGEIYELFFGEMMKYYEQNCSYSLQALDGTQGVLHVSANPYIAEAIGVRELGNRQICSLKAGMIASAMDYLGLPFARVKETSCVHRGDDVCRFEFDFSQAAFRFDRGVERGSEMTSRSFQ